MQSAEFDVEKKNRRRRRRADEDVTSTKIAFFTTNSMSQFTNETGEEKQQPEVRSCEKKKSTW